MVSRTDITRVEKNQSHPDYTFKVILTGEKGTGKSSLVRRITENTFLENYVPTIAGDFSCLYYTLNTGTATKNIRVTLWDTSGEEKYRSVTKNYFAGASAALVLYDLTDKKSFDRVPFWINLVNESTGINTVVYLVGAKNDLIDQRVVKMEDVEVFMEAEKGKIYDRADVSSKTGDGVNELFKSLVKSMVEEKERSESFFLIGQGHVKPSEGGIPLKPKSKRKNGGCSC